ncbi:MAG: alpha-1,4-glucan--maltose-1-phosphate maltosyltransferase [Xanthomonadales bacterium]|nr:alpha-1,4-glucan--maltose-1-phosphate maltosyltransferase [Xanthomonadales bacterium]
MTAAPGKDIEGRQRVVIEKLRPASDCGRFPVKRIVAERMTVEADVFTDGHDQIQAVVKYRTRAQRRWREVPMVPLGNDRWQGQFTVEEIDRYCYTVSAWVDPFLTWRSELTRRSGAADIRLALELGSQQVQQAAARARPVDARRLSHWAERLAGDGDLEARRALALDSDLLELMLRHADRSFASEYAPVQEVTVERERARYGAWYELFPRSFGGLRGAAEKLSYVSEMGFDVIYLPPIHPIGSSQRKGPNNALAAGPDDPGSPWAIGSPDGGHKSIHPELGTEADFDAFIATAARLDLEVALDIAFQCSPDHPYVREHPEWFSWRPDGTVQYAENPPKKYQDIYPFNFETDDWQALWRELLSVFLHWAERGVRIFRVDNPHTKPFPFWEWVIAEVRHRHPDTIFLAEAFTRPRVMHRLAKLGFSQSYTYFTWRNTKPELTDYALELAHTEGSEYFRPNLWPNTPDILSEYLQFGGRPAFITRLVLAATLSASYGIYGPAFELGESEPREPGSEEYLDSEKYQLREWDLERPESLRDLIARVNRIRRDNPALHLNRNLRFHEIDNEQLVCYSKATEDEDNVVLVVVNLDPHHRQGGWLTLSLNALGLTGDEPFQMHDQLGNLRLLWHGAHNYIDLDPGISPAHIFRLRRHLRTERDFAYYM